MLTRLLIVATFGIFTFLARAQDIYLQNVPQSLVFLNPSFAGSNGKFRLQNNYQTNYQGVYPLSTIRSCADFYVKALHAGVGFSFLHDNFNKGLQTTSMASLAYAQHLAFNKGKLKVIPSMEVSYFKKKLDLSSVTFGDLIDLRNNNAWIDTGTLPQPEKSNVDVNAGLLVNYRTLFAGVSVKHITQPDIGLMGAYKLPALINVHFSYSFGATPWYDANFNVRYSRQKDKNRILCALNIVTFRRIVCGAGIVYGNSTPFINIGYKHKYFGVQFLYQGNPYVLKQAFKSNGVMEMSLSLNLAAKNEYSKAAFELW